MAPRWFPLESNPDVMTMYISDLGAEGVRVVEVLSIEDWALDMVPGPVHAVLFLYPLSPRQLEFDSAHPPDPMPSTSDPTSGAPYFMKQTVGNACGTVALLHALGNHHRAGAAAARPDSWLAEFFSATAKMTAEEIASYIAEGAASDALAKVHTATATSSENATAATMDVETHFVAFVCAGGTLYELDGRKAGPTVHGPCEASELLPKAVGAISKCMKRDPDELRFTITALVGNDAGA